MFVRKAQVPYEGGNWIHIQLNSVELVHNKIQIVKYSPFDYPASDIASDYPTSLFAKEVRLSFIT